MKIKNYKYKIKFVYVYLDNDELVKIYPEIFERYYNIIINNDFDEILWNQVLEDNDYYKAKENVLNLLSYSFKTESEIVTYLRRKKYSNKIRDKIILYLKENKLIDDKSFTENYINELKKYKKKGPYYIKQKLYERGIKNDNIEEVIAKLYSEEEKINNIRNLIEKKIKKLSKFNGNKLKQKLLLYLLQLGYDYETAYGEINDYINNIKKE